MEPADANAITSPVIRRLTIERFRGIQSLTWYPGPGTNAIIGGGDTGKTTVLEAVALLLSPSNSVVLSDADYWLRDVASEFCIEAVMSLPSSCGISGSSKHAWPWEWDGKEPKLPALDEEGETLGTREAVYRLRVRGTSDFDVLFEVLQPDDECAALSVSMRRRIGLVRLASDDRNDRDLRLVQGSGLDRLISDSSLRARLAHALAGCDIQAELTDQAKENLKALNDAFTDGALPSGLILGLTGSQGFSVNALIGLLAEKEAVHLPLASWGAGTRRLAALEIAGVHGAGKPITIVDEIERGLEPYRQRDLIRKLKKSGSQVFLTTHSAASLAALADAAVWHMDSRSAWPRTSGTARKP